LSTKLDVYNQTLLTIGSRSIATLSDNRVERRTLDAVYAPSLAFMLEAAMWPFAARSIEIDASDTVESNFGWEYVFEKPDDYVRLIKISDNENMSITLEPFDEESDYFLANATPLYIQYVSNDVNYGGDPGKWPETFATALSDEMAFRAAPQITHTPQNTRDFLLRNKRLSLINAKTKASVNQSVSRMPQGRLVTSRGGGGRVNGQRRTPYT
jgi:hypothetical protein